jgi:hypothetical protein
MNHLDSEAVQKLAVVYAQKLPAEITREMLLGDGEQ